ncbi:MAG TPA: ATPase, T2SS/T4P/T4SS family [Candidatus Paceibacterota bacterium]|nr:ATPase, T2SS/T4P/T4SS family [Candidatus Paceibacterota bacterium]
MASSPTDKTQDLQVELEKKLESIGAKEQALQSQALAQKLGLPYLELTGLPIDSEALRALSEEVSRSSGVALVQAKGPAGLAVTLNPTQPAAKTALEELKKQHTELRVAIVSPSTMDVVWKRYATIKTVETFEVGTITIDDASLARIQESIKSVDDIKNLIASATITQILEILIAGALTTHASDVHLEPGADTVRLRYRLDGLLHDIVTIEPDQFRRVLNRVKVLAKMKLNITHSPQDGRFTIEQSGVPIEVRVSSLPSEYGEGLVMRLLDPRTIQANLTDLGIRPDVLEQVRSLLRQPQGTILTTGPTGSGKTTTLYAFLNEINSPDTKIITVEDPIEYHIAGVNQSQVDPAKGYTFASGLRSIVRQDPDVILIGEIRDLETAEIALEAALTGHLVLSTIHTNDAAGAVPRLVDLGVKSETIAAALSLVMAQRLLRRLCMDCRVKATLPAAEAETIRKSLTPLKERFRLPIIDTDLPVFVAGGCAKCNNTGYRGRIGVYEVFPVSREMERLVIKNAPVSDIRDLAIKEGMVTLLQDGYLKLVEGVTSLEEVRRVLGH